MTVRYMAVLAGWTCLASLMIGSLAAASDGFPREGRRDNKDPLEGKPPPALQVREWYNTQGKIPNLSDLKGKVVVIDFWGTWCAPCRESMPKLKKLLDQHADKGLVIIGVHSTVGGHTVPEFLVNHNVTWPIAVDRDGRTVAGWAVDSYPDYYLIDRSGTLRVADLENDALESAVEILLAEPAP